MRPLDRFLDLSRENFQFLAEDFGCRLVTTEKDKRYGGYAKVIWLSRSFGESAHIESETAPAPQARVEPLQCLDLRRAAPAETAPARLLFNRAHQKSGRAAFHDC